MDTKRIPVDHRPRHGRWLTAAAVLTAAIGTLELLTGPSGRTAGYADPIAVSSKNGQITGTVTEPLNVRQVPASGTRVDLAAKPVAQLKVGTRIQVRCAFTGTNAPGAGNTWYRITGPGIPSPAHGTDTVASAKYLQVDHPVPACTGTDQKTAAAEQTSGCGPQHTSRGGFVATACLSAPHQIAAPDAYVTTPADAKGCKVTVGLYAVGGAFLDVSVDGSMLYSDTFDCQPGRQHYGRALNLVPQQVNWNMQLQDTLGSNGLRTVVDVAVNGTDMVSADSPVQGGDGGPHGTAATPGGVMADPPAASNADHTVTLTCTTSAGPPLAVPPSPAGVIAVPITAQVSPKGLITGAQAGSPVIKGVNVGASIAGLTATTVTILHGGRALEFSGQVMVNLGGQLGPVDIGGTVPQPCDAYLTPPFTTTR